jgi:hypothetical protein
MTASGAVWYPVILEPNAMEIEKEKVSKSDVWGLKKEGRNKESRVWNVLAGFVNRAGWSFDENPPTRYERIKFDAVVIFYDPRSPRKTFELVWTKVRPGPASPS